MVFWPMHWRRRCTSLRCDEVCTGLVQLGFTVRDGRRGGHKIVSHSGLPDFLGTNFDCGHGRNGTVKPAYIRKLLRILDEFRDILEQYG